MSRDLVPFGGVAEVAHVEVARQKQVRADRREPRQRDLRPADQAPLGSALRQIEGTARRNDSDDTRRGGFQRCGGSSDLSLTRPAGSAREDRPSRAA